MNKTVFWPFQKSPHTVIALLRAWCFQTINTVLESRYSKQQFQILNSIYVIWCLELETSNFIFSCSLFLSNDLIFLILFSNSLFTRVPRNRRGNSRIFYVQLSHILNPLLSLQEDTVSMLCPLFPPQTVIFKSFGQIGSARYYRALLQVAHDTALGSYQTAQLILNL